MDDFDENEMKFLRILIQSESEFTSYVHVYAQLKHRYKSAKAFNKKAEILNELNFQLRQIRTFLERKASELEQKNNPYLIVKNEHIINIDRNGVRLDLLNLWKSIFNNKVKNPPASFLLKIAGFLPKKQRQILQQEVLLMRDEYNEALFEKRMLRAKIIVISYYLGISCSSFRWVTDKVKEVIGIIPKKD